MCPIFGMIRSFTNENIRLIAINSIIQLNNKKYYYNNFIFDKFSNSNFHKNYSYKFRFNTKYNLLV